MGVFGKHECPPVANKVQNLLFLGIKVMVKVTRSLTLVSSERVSLVEYACHANTEVSDLSRFKSYGNS